MKPNRVPTAAAAGLLVTLVATAALGQSGPQIDPFADHLLRRMGETLKAAGSFSLHNEATVDDATGGSQMIQLGQSIDIVVRRPDALWADMRGDLGPRRIWFDGERFTLLDLGQGFFARAEVSGPIGRTLDWMMEEYGVLMPMAELAFEDPYATLIEKVETGNYLGLTTVDGVDCHHLAFTQELVDWQIWIADGYPMVPRKVVITYKQEPGAPQYTARLSRWDLSASPPDALFQFEPPRGAREIEFMPAEKGSEQ